MTKKNRKHSAGIVLRDILLALLLVAVVAASAILVYRRFFESGPGHTGREAEHCQESL